MNKTQISKEKFLQNEMYQKCNRELKEMFITLFNELEEENINFVVKIRKNNSIALSPTSNINKNIITIWIYSNHLRITFYNEDNININSKEDIDKSLLNRIKNKYYKVNKDKKQISIYLTEDLINKLQKKSAENNKKLNEFITETIEAKLNPLFINIDHENEFYILIRDYGIDVKDNNLSSESSKKAVAFFYVISAYQNDYLTLYNAKFEYDKKSKSLTGPSELITNWNNDMYNCCAAAYGISEILSGNISIQKFIKLLDDDDNGNIFKILINSLKILYGKYTIKNGEIIPVKSVTIFKTINDINDFLNNDNKGED